MSDATVKQADARILREALSKVERSAPPHVKKVIRSALLQYAAAIGPYCTCPERWPMPGGEKTKCMDCGKESPA